MSLIALDLGGTFLKSALVDLDRPAVRAVAREPFPAFEEGLPPGHKEVDPEAIVAAARAAIDRLAALAPDAEGIVLCNQMHGFVLLADDGRARSRYVSWQDRRALERHGAGADTHLDALRARLSDGERQALGNETRAGIAVATLFAMGGVPDGVEVAALGDYVVARLCGVRETTIEATHAAALGSFDLRAGAWHAGVIARLGLDRARWPRVVPAGTVVGRMRAGGRERPVYTPVGDQQAALLGSLLREGELSLNIATGSQASRRVGSAEAGDWQLRPFFDGGWLRTVTHLPAGRVLRILVEASGRGWADLLRAAEVAAAGAPVDLASLIDGGPALARAWLAREPAGAVMRAAFRDMAARYADAAARLFPGGGWRRVLLSGGLARRSEALRAEIRSGLPGEIALAPASEDTLVGLLALALRWTGRVGHVDEAIGRLAAGVSCDASTPEEPV